MTPLVIYTDGGARGNPGPAGAGVVIYEGETKRAEVAQFLGEKQTNNWAEYEALLIALGKALELGFLGRDLEIRMDSELIVKQMRGEYRVKEPALKSQALKVKSLLANFGAVAFVHVPRKENAEADALANDAMDRRNV